MPDSSEHDDSGSVLRPPQSGPIDMEIEGDWRMRELKARLFGGEHVPHRVGRFVVLGPLGRGGMGSVQRAFDEVLERQVAIKIMHRRSGGRDDERVLREAQALARLSHPNVVQVYDVGQVDDRLFIAMELITGQTLRQWQQRARPWQETARAYLQAGRGLAAAHAVGLVHRDFKPSNCIVDDEGRVRVLDFGLARASAESEADRDTAPTLDIDGPTDGPGVAEQRRTQTSSIAGTLGYMAPEQLRGQAVDARADQFSFCASLYQGLFGQLPFDPAQASELLKAGEEAPLPAAPPGGHRVPRVLVDAMWRGLAIDPQSRWPSMDELLRVVERVLRGRSPKWATLGLVAVGVLTATVAASQPVDEPDFDPCRDAGQQVDGLWGEDARSTIEDALGSAWSSHSEDAWLRAENELDDYHDELREAYEDACKATLVRHEQTLDDQQRREACLDQRASALRQTVSLLSRPDAQVAEEAVSLVVELPRIEACSDLEALSRIDEPQSTGDRQRQRKLLDDLEKARALETAGKADEGLQLVTALVARAEELSEARLGAEARLLEGTLLSDLGRHDEAAEPLETAVRWSLEHEDYTLALEALSTTIYVVGVEQAKTDAALLVGAIAEAHTAREDHGGRAEARVLTSIGQVHSERGEHEEAQARYEEAIELLEGAVGEDHISLADPLDSLGQALRRQKRLDEALTASRRALAIRERWLGDGHPKVAHQHINIGVILRGQRRYEDAEGEYRHALGMLEGTGPAHAETVALARTNLGALLAEMERFDEAAVELRKAIAAWELELDPAHPRVAAVRQSLGRVLEGAGQPDAAREQYQQVIAILEHAEETPKQKKMLTKVRARLAELPQPGSP